MLHGDDQGVALIDTIARGEGCLRTALSHGHCSDFRTPVGESNEWVTAYVAGSLRPTAQNAIVRARAAEFLLSRQRWNGGWGYNHLCPADADSTAAATRFLASSVNVSPSRLARSARFLIAHIDPASGGTRTYRRTFGLRVLMRAWRAHFNGWRMAHSCVTAASGEALRLCDGFATVIDRLGDFLARTQRKDGSWLGYWWDDRLYATAAALSFMADSGQLSKLRHDPAEWVLLTRNADGGWSAPYARLPSPFATALAVTTLDVATGGGRSLAIQGGVRWLIDHQLSDGSWASVPIMRIPHPFDCHPDRQSQWRVNQLGTGVLIQDQHRRFTTATVLRCLAGQVSRKVGTPDPARARSLSSICGDPQTPSDVEQLAPARPERH